MSTDRQTPYGGGLVLLLTRDIERFDPMGQALSARGIALRLIRSAADLLADLDRIAPTGAADSVPLLVLLDSRALADTEALSAIAAALRARTAPEIPLVCLAPTADIQYRLAALRAHAAECLEPDLEPEELAARLAGHLGAGRSEPDRVLIVDDQPVAALFAARILESAGMRTERVGSPMDVLEALVRFQPHLILMDLHMPGVSGIELTGIIREQTRFAYLPILFLSGELDRELQLVALRVGGDDFLAKPVAPELLVQAVRDRLIRSRRLAPGQGATGTDPQSGLAVRERLLKTLDRRIRPDQPPGGGLIYLELPTDGVAWTRIGAEISGRLAAGDLAARAGEHGIAVLARRADVAELATFAQVLGQAAWDAMGRSGSETGVSSQPDLGIGWCPLEMSGGEAVTLISRARKAARASLEGGQRRATGYGESDAPPGPAKPSPIPAAIEEGRLQLLFQPMVALRGRAAERYEATPRLHTPDGELLAPAAFVSQAMRAGLAERVDRWMLETGLDALRDCRDGGRSVGLFIHQSLASAADDDWIGRLRAAIADRDLIRLRPILQLQVGDADRNLALAERRAAELGHLGIRLCLNGLSEGERGTRVLEALPAAFVRLAADAVQSLSEERLKALAAQVRARGALAIATGADGPRTVERLYLAGVDLIQGPFVQPPTETMDFDFRGSDPMD